MKKTALIVMDFIKDIVHEDGKLSGKRNAPEVNRRHIITNTNKALAFARKENWVVALAKVGFHKSYNEQPKFSPLFGKAHEYGVLGHDTDGLEFHPDLDVQPSDFVFIKPRVSAFYATPLEAILRANRVENIVLCGVSTGWCVLATAIDGHDRDYVVHILEDCCAAHEESVHHHMIQHMKTISHIIKTDALGTFLLPGH